MKAKGILVVDDDSTVLSMISGWLSKYGYTVFTAADIGGALELYQLHPGEIGLLMTDVKLRHESGFELADSLEEDFGFGGCVFFTSFFWEAETAKELLRRGKPYFEKPLKFKDEILPFLERYFAGGGDE